MTTEELTTDALGFSDEDLMAAFGPFVTRHFPAGDPEWATIVDQTAQTQVVARRRRRWLGWIRRFRRTQRGIRGAYSLQWSATPLEAQLTGGHVAPFVFRDHTFEARTQGEKRVQHKILFRVIDRLGPRRVLEVGAGNGVNLLALAARFPKLDLTGLELTTGGVQAAARVRGMPALPRVLTEFSVEALKDGSLAHRRVGLVQGTGASLPFPDQTFDLVYTVLALEQMEEIRDRVLPELRRVSRGYVLMIEPFRDWNAFGIRRDYVVANDYFSASVADLPAFHLQPTYVDEVPAKLFRGAGVVLAKTV